jgi:hypothetical protein
MRYRRVLVTLMAGAVVALPASLLAQQMPSRPAPKANQQQPDLDVEELTPGQIQRAQERQRAEEQKRIQDMQRAQDQRRQQEQQRAQERTQEREPAAPKSAAPKAPPASAPTTTATAARAVACSGPFAKESNHIKLAQVFNSLNITFTEVDAGGTRIMASVLFPNDPKRRLEVWWQNEAARSGTHLIVINGQSTWSAPKGLHLGLGLAAVEKLNGKPFKLKGFEKDGGTTTDWQGGGLLSLPGGCKVGVKFAPDPKAPEAARAETLVGSEFESTDAAMRAVRPSITEIIIGY